MPSVPCLGSHRIESLRSICEPWSLIFEPSFGVLQERVKLLTPQQRAKYREKQEKLQLKKMSKTRMMKM